MLTKLKTSRLFFKAILVIANAVFVAATVTHITLGQSATEVTGLLAILDHVFDLTLALGLCFFVLSIGYAACNIFRLNFANTAEALSFSLFLGTGTLGLAILFLGLLGLLRTWSVSILLIAALLAVGRNLREQFRLVQRGVRAATATRENQILTILFLCLIALLLLRALTPPSTPDELIYHLPVSRDFAKRGSIYPSYDNFFGNLPLLINMIYVLCQMAGSDISARVFSLFLAIATAFALYGFCRRFLTHQVGVVAIFAFFGAGMVVEVAVTARIDISLAGMLFLATYAIMIYLETGQRRWLWVSAILAGFSLGIKSSAGPWLFFVGIMYLFEEVRRKRRLVSPILTRGIAYIVIAMVVACPWYIKNYIWFHNPIYPFFTGEVADFGPQGIRYFNTNDEQKLDGHLATARNEVPEGVNAQEQEIRRAIDSRLTRNPMRFWELFTQPDKYLVSEPFHFPNYLFLLTPLLFFVSANRRILWLLGISVAFFSSVTWSSWIARYLLPVYPSLTIVSAYILSELSRRLGQRLRFSQNLPVWATSIALSSVLIVSAVWISGFNALHFISGDMSRHTFLRQFPFYHRIDFINTRLPERAQVLTVGAHMNYGIEKAYVTDEGWFATKWRRLLVRNDSLEKVSQDLHQQGFTHILYCSGPFVYEANLGIKGSGGMDLVAQKDDHNSDPTRIPGPEYQLFRNWATFTLYRAKFLESVYLDDSNCEVLRIK